MYGLGIKLAPLFAISMILIGGINRNFSKLFKISVLLVSMCPCELRYF
jgi:hypothetical protein